MVRSPLSLWKSTGEEPDGTCNTVWGKEKPLSANGMNVVAIMSSYLVNVLGRLRVSPLRWVSHVSSCHGVQYGTHYVRDVAPIDTLRSVT